MKTMTQTVWLLALAAGLCMYLPVAGQQGKYRYAQTNQLVGLVNEAAVLINHSGEGCFPALMKRGSQWRNGDLYTFVIDVKGNCFVHEDTSLIGKNISELKDRNGKPIIQWFIRKALSPTQCGWTHYRWVRPGDTLPVWKTTFSRLASAPSGVVYVVGAGLYDMKMERAFAMEAVDDAAILMRQMGVAAFPVLRNPSSEFVYKDTYVFIVDSTYTVMVNPAFPGEEGKVVYDYQDSDGKYFFREFFKVATEAGSGWVGYRWPKPGESHPSPKSTFVKKIKVRGMVYLIGTGIYDE